MIANYNPDKHEYQLGTRKVPSVTKVIDVAIGGAYKADPWYLERGNAVHQAAAFICQGKEFECDPRIAGYVAACKKFIEQVHPVVLDVELIVSNSTYQYAGRLDLLCKINGKLTIVDWKSGSMDVDRVMIQLGGYSQAHESKPDFGMGVELHEDGTYKTTAHLSLKQSRNEFLACRTVYGIKERMGLNKKEKADG